MAPSNHETARALQALFPDGPDMPCCVTDGPAIQVGKAPGRDGLRVRYLLDAMAPPARGMGSVLIDSLVGFVNVVLLGRFLWRFGRSLRAPPFSLFKNQRMGGCGKVPEP
jgi:hypothetical protein